MHKKGSNMATMSHLTPKLPKVNERGFRLSFIRGTSLCTHERPVKTHLLPGIGTFVIDTPKDKELCARQRCFRYQEAHRGVVRKQTKTIPEIPKRHGMKNLPIVQLKDMNAKAPSRRPTPEQDQGQGRPDSPSFTGSVVSQSDSSSEKPRKLEAQPLKLPSQDELVSRSPLGRIVQQGSGGDRQNSPVSINGFGVRKVKPIISSCKPGVERREFTNLTANLPLAEPEATPCKATERELESQAEYRKQLTFYLSQMLDQQAQEQPPPITTGKEDSVADDDDDDDEDGETRDVGRRVYADVHADNVGHTSKHREWESSISLGEMLINTTPDLRKRLKLDLMSRDTSSGKSGQRTSPEVTKHRGKRPHAAPSRCWNSENKKIGRSNGASNSNNNNNNNNNEDNSSTDNNNNNNNNNINENKTKTSATKCPSLPRRKRCTGTHSRNALREDVPYDDDDDDGCQENERRRGLNCNDNEQLVGCIIGPGGVAVDGGNADDDEEYDDDQYDEVVDEKWLHMVNTPVVERGVYDRYANVKLPPSWSVSNKKSSPVRTSIHSVPSNRGVVPGACAMAGVGSTSLATNCEKTPVLSERKHAGRVK